MKVLFDQGGRHSFEIKSPSMVIVTFRARGDAERFLSLPIERLQGITTRCWYCNFCKQQHAPENCTNINCRDITSIYVAERTAAALYNSEEQVSIPAKSSVQPFLILQDAKHERGNYKLTVFTVKNPQFHLIL